MKINVEINLEHFRYSLVGDGYTLKQAEALTDRELEEIFKTRVINSMEKEYYKGLRLGLYEAKEEATSVSDRPIRSFGGFTFQED